MNAPQRDLTPVTAAATPRAEYAPIIPAPEPHAIPAGRRKPDHEYEYRAPDGSLCFIIQRFDATESDPKKRFAQWSYGTLTKPDTEPQTGWHARGIPAGRPLYNAPMLAANPTAPVLIVEGEETAKAAARHLPAGWIATTWAGGAQAIRATDWQPLAGRRCVTWPDNDGPGIKAAAEIAAILTGLQSPNAIVSLPRALPDAWDLADPLPAAADGTPALNPAEIIAKTASLASLPSAEPDPRPSAPPHSAENTDLDRSYIPVGYDETQYWVISRRKQKLVGYTSGRLLKQDGILDIDPDIDAWAARWDSGDGRIAWNRIGSVIMQQCLAAGPFDPERIRGRGAWLDAKRTVIHLGDQLIVDGVPTPPIDFKSKYFYPLETSLLPDLPPAALTAKEGNELRTLCRKLKWERPIYADMLAGWIATSVVCGAQKWRPHAWVTGPSGAGKSFVATQIIERAVGDLAIYPLGNSSEAGIRSILERDARPVIYDEAEGRGKAGQERRERIIELMRAASSDSRGAMFKGSANHEAAVFQIRSQFLLASIGVGLQDAADIGRCVVLTLQKNEAFTDAQKADRDAHFADIRTRVTNLPTDLAGRLFLRMAQRIPELHASIEAFSRAISLRLGDRRDGDTIGTLLAGAYILASDKAATPAFADSYVANAVKTGALDDFLRGKEVREDASIIKHLTSRILRVPLPSGGTTELAIGELCAITTGRTYQERVSAETAEQTLRRHGVRTCAEPKGFYIAHDHPALDQLMATSEYGQGYLRILQRHPDAKTSAKTMWFGGPTVRGTWLPVQMVLGEAE